MSRSYKLITPAIIIILVSVILDLISKYWIETILGFGQTTPIIDGFFNIVHARNYGSAFSFLHDAPVWFRKPFLIIVPLIAMCFIIYIMYKSAAHKLQFFGFTAVLGGALGNFISRMYSGYVVDFLDFRIIGSYHWPSFNVADIAITVGVLLVITDMMKIEYRKKKQKKK